MRNLTKNLGVRIITIVFTALFLLAVLNPSAEAANYSVGFKSSNIEITSPTVNKAEFAKKLTISGKSSLDTVYLLLRGPGGELSVYPVPVHNGSFKKDIWLRFGAGEYTVWAGDNDRKFDGKIRFLVRNSSTENYFDLTPSGYVNSDDPVILGIKDTLIKEDMDDLTKLKVIHDWVAGNITYDVDAYYSGDVAMNTALDVLKSKKGTCRDYSFVFASLARAAGIPTRVIYGDALNTATGTYEKHAWNESFVNGKWVKIDTTWDAGYISNKKFVASVSTKYFVDEELFNKTHKTTSVTQY
ncbi:MAG: transglutaminase domain-containing protein [Peptococcaceae bacterium]|nr:transglutaminase domain-containing protein [Peptococcaceae bacterium]